MAFPPFVYGLRAEGPFRRNFLLLEFLHQLVQPRRPGLSERDRVQAAQQDVHLVVREVIDVQRDDEIAEL